MLADRARLFALLLYTLFVAGCGGGGGSPGYSQGGGDPGPGTGQLALVVTNLPSGVDAVLRVTGPGDFKRDLTGSATLTDLAPGSYTVAAAGITAGAASYIPMPASQAVQVKAGSSATAAISYAIKAASLGLTEVANGLDNPVLLTAPPGDARQFVVERTGRIMVIQDGKLLAQPFLDLGSRISNAGEGGLLSLAFDPHYASNGYFYVHYIDQQQNITVERLLAMAGSSRAETTSGLVILRVPHTDTTSHYGGLLAFGPDGYLYLSTGDGGLELDPQGNAHNLDSLLGKLLRIDVSHASAAQPYAVPAANPYAGQPRRRGEIWASGLRNPRRFAFDDAQLYIADVGQARREEVDIAAVSKGGLDYGWNTMEGSLCLADGCDRNGLALPAFEYGHGNVPDGPCAIVGGFVYRGSAMPELSGRYFYSDYCAGFLKSFVAGDGSVIDQRDWAVQAIGRVVSFGRDGQGELYLVTESGSIYKIGRTFAPKG
jgi:glucose/arabinose dehydrogenase